MAKDLKDVRVGDRVWISEGYSGKERGDLVTVTRLTPKQIVVGRRRYKRGTPSRFGSDPTYYGIGTASGRITFIATPQECAVWDANIARCQAEMDARKQRDADAEAKRTELAALFPSYEDRNRGTTVRDAEYGGKEDRANRYAVTFHNLTESEVRELAQLIK